MLENIEESRATSDDLKVALESSPATFMGLLAERSKDRSLSKRDRTRYQIFLVVAQSYLEDAHRPPTVEYILESTALSRGTFYNHFKDVDTCVFELLLQFFDYLQSKKMVTPRGLSRYETLLVTNTRYCRIYEANANLFAVVSHNPELVEIRARRNASWVQRVVRASERRRGIAYIEGQRVELEGMARMLITMTIEVLRDRFVLHDTLLTKAYPTVEKIAEAMTHIWDSSLRSFEES